MRDNQKVDMYRYFKRKAPEGSHSPLHEEIGEESTPPQAPSTGYLVANGKTTTTQRKIIMAHVAASSSPSSDALVLPDSIKFLLRVNEDKLLRYTTDWMKTTLVQNIQCSSIALVGNFVYVVGGIDNQIPTSQVVFYDITESSISFRLVKKQGPSLNSPKWYPKLVVMGSKLFAFSWRFHDNDSSRIYGSPLCAPESLPICEFLDTSSPLNKWCPLTSFPTLPPPRTKNLSTYSIVSFAVQLNNHALFLSFGHGYGRRHDIITAYSVCYDDSTNLWTNVQPTTLPFVGEGKVVEDLCFGFPFGMDNRDNDYVACYKLTVDWEMTKTFTWLTLATYSLLSNSTLNTYPSLFSFFPVSSNALTTIRAKSHCYFSSDYSSEYSLELEVLELLPLKVEKKQLQLQGIEQIIDIHSSHVLSTTSYTLYYEPQEIVGAYW